MAVEAVGDAVVDAVVRDRTAMIRETGIEAERNRRTIEPSPASDRDSEIDSAHPNDRDHRTAAHAGAIPYARHQTHHGSMYAQLLAALGAAVAYSGAVDQRGR